MATLTARPAAKTTGPHRMHGKAMPVRLVLSARLVFDASAYLRFPLAATPRFQPSAIEVILLVAEPASSAAMGMPAPE
jgi:hypothetical protein